MTNFQNKHESMRGYFAYELYEQMKKNPDIILVVGDLGYGMWTKIQEDFPDRFINVGAAEQAGVGICVGLALEGKIPFFYSITNFALYRGFEWIRNYINYEKIPVCIVGAGRGDDYKDDGYTHQSFDAPDVLHLFKNITKYVPSDKMDIQGILKDIINSKQPAFLSLLR
jgi:transketolase